MNKQPLISLIVLSYKNYKYIFDALDSILCQDYKNIEIIVSNDFSDDFNIERVSEYINKNKKNNIKNYFVYNNSKNIGTVKSINKAIKLSKGEYLIFIAADDVLYDKHVISNYINKFNNISDNELIVISQVYMYDQSLNKLIQPFMSSDNIKKLINLKPKEYFAEIATNHIVPCPSACYRRKIFKKFGFFDEDYVLVEDLSSALKYSRLGIKYNFSNFISFKHRDGGISHGNFNGNNLVKRQFDSDILNILSKEVLPYIKLFDNNHQREFLTIYQDKKIKFEFNYELKNKSLSQKRDFLKKNFKNIIFAFLRDINQEAYDQLKGKKIKILILGLVLIFLSNVTYRLQGFLFFFGFILIVISELLIINNFKNKYSYKILKFVKLLK